MTWAPRPVPASRFRVTATGVVLVEARPARALLLAAAPAVSAYYWFTPGAVARGWALDTRWIVVIRTLTLSLVAFRAFRALVRETEPSLATVRLDP